jgi:hypothetical protein
MGAAPQVPLIRSQSHLTDLVLSDCDQHGCSAGCPDTSQSHLTDLVLSDATDVCPATDSCGTCRSQSHLTDLVLSDGFALLDPRLIPAATKSQSHLTDLVLSDDMGITPSAGGISVAIPPD